MVHVILRDVVGDGGVNLADLVLDVFEQRSDVTFEQAVSDVLAAV